MHVFLGAVHMFAFDAVFVSIAGEVDSVHLFIGAWNATAGNAPNLTRCNKITIQGTPHMTVDNEAISLSRVYTYYSKCNALLLTHQTTLTLTF